MKSPMSVSIASREVTFTSHGGLLTGQGLPNSLGAIERALEAGAARIEIDVHSIADGEYLVCHANRLEEATTSRGAVGRLTREQALALRSKRSYPRCFMRVASRSAPGRWTTTARSRSRSWRGWQRWASTA